MSLPKATLFVFAQEVLSFAGQHRPLFSTPRTSDFIMLKLQEALIIHDIGQ